MFAERRGSSNASTESGHKKGADPKVDPEEWRKVED